MTVRQGLMISHRKYTTIDNQVTKHKILSKKHCHLKYSILLVRQLPRNSVKHPATQFIMPTTLALHLNTHGMPCSVTHQEHRTSLH